MTEHMVFGICFLFIYFLVQLTRVMVSNWKQPHSGGNMALIQELKNFGWELVSSWLESHYGLELWSGATEW